MAERVSGPYRGYYISASARLTEPADHAEPAYIGTVNVAQGYFDNARRYEALVDLGGPDQRFTSEEDALAFVERAARDYIDRLLQ